MRTRNRSRRAMALVATTGVAATGLVVATTGTANAWKPPTHIFGVEAALQDALDGYVTIQPVDGDPSPVTIEVDPTIKAALKAHPEAYRAGTAGPDAYPDILFGQGQIHPDTRTHNSDPDTSEWLDHDAAYSTEWLSHLWKEAWKPLPAGQEDERLRRIAFALGYMGGHAAGDTFAHTWINQMAGGVFPDFTDLANSDISLRHVVIEGYVDKHRPGADSDPKTTYEMAAPLDFVGDTLILSKFAREHSSSPIYDYFFEKQAALQVDAAIRDYDLDWTDCAGIEPDCHTVNQTLRVDTATGTQFVHVTHDECADDVVVCLPDPTDIVEPFDHLMSSYEHAWIDDITAGLRAWPAVSEAIGRELFDGGNAEFGPIGDALEDWIFNHLLSMMGLPDFVGEGIYSASEFIDKIVSFVTSTIASIVDPITDELRDDFPAIADLYDKVDALVTKTKDKAVEALTDIADDLAGVIITVGLGFTNLNPTVADALDKDNDGFINPTEALDVFKNPEDFLSNEALFPPDQFPGGIRAKLDEEMHLSGGVDDDENNVFRDYDPQKFAPLRDTTTMAKLAMLNASGLNGLVRTVAGRTGNSDGLTDMYDVYAPKVGDVAAAGWEVPNNVMLGWHKSLDAEYQWRTNSLRDGRSYGLGTMWLFEDCVARDTVMRKLFLSPVKDVDAFTDEGDPATPLTDTTGASTAIGVVSGPTAVRDGQTYVGSGTRIGTATTDNYFPKSKLSVRTSVTAQDATASYGSYGAAEPTPFGLTGDDGAYTVRAQAQDGCGTAGPADAETYVLDATGPSVSISSPVDDATYTTNDTPSVTAMISDAGSGVDSSSATLDDAPIAIGGTVDTFMLDPGPHTVTVTVTDALGNSTTTSVSFRVRATATSLVANVDRAWSMRLITDPKVYKGLKDSLTSAQQSHAVGKHSTEWNQLAAFVNKVVAQLGQGIDATTGQRFIAFANDLIAARG